MWKRDESVRPPGAQRYRSVEAEASRWQSCRDGGHESRQLAGHQGGAECIRRPHPFSQMEGSIRLPGHNTIGPHADIKAEISAKAVVIVGAVAGNVTAGEKVEIQATGSVTGDIVSPRLVVADGGYLRGRVETAHVRPGQQEAASSAFGRRVAHTARHFTSRAIRRSVSRRWRCGRYSASMASSWRARRGEGE